MVDSNIDRLRRALDRVDQSLSGIELRTPIELLLSTPEEPLGESSGGVAAGDLSDRLHLEAEAACDVERLLREAQKVAKALHTEKRHAAAAVLAQAQKVAEVLQADQDRAADAVLAEAGQVADELRAGKGRSRPEPRSS